MDATITNQVISKSLLGGHVTVTITAGNQGTPVTVKGLSVDTTGFDADNAVFNNLIVSTGSTGMDFTQMATPANGSPNATVLTHATIEAPYLLANMITLPNLSLAISVH